jgi:DNA-binding transcriptional regulator YiaG
MIKINDINEVCKTCKVLNSNCAGIAFNGIIKTCNAKIDQSNTITAATQIKSARKASGLSQLAMSKRLGIPARTIEDWEAGKSHPSDWVVKLVVDKLKHIKTK